MGLTNLTFENDGAGDQSVAAKRPLEGWDGYDNDNGVDLERLKKSGV